VRVIPKKGLIGMASKEAMGQKRTRSESQYFLFVSFLANVT